jgi:hypothetical protein
MPIRKRLLAISMVAFALVTGCAEAGPTPPDERSSAITAHDPARHGIRADLVPASIPAYATVQGGSASGVGGAIHLEVDAAAEIPRFPDAYISSVAVFGYAWADVDTGEAIVAVIHPVIGRDSNQNPDGWHTHPVQLATGAGGSDFCILSIGTSQGGIAIRQDRLRLNMAGRQAGIQPSELDVAASFIVQSEAGCAASGLGVVVLHGVSL